MVFKLTPDLKKILIFIMLLNFGGITKLYASDELSYDVEISGLEDNTYEGIRSVFDGSSTLQAQKSATLISISRLRGYLKSDIELMEQILRSVGYYDARIEENLIRQNNHFKISIHITPGELYSYGIIKIDYQDVIPDEDIRVKIRDRLGLIEGAPARAQSVLTSKALIAEILPEFGFPFAEILGNDFVVDHRTRLLNITYTIKPGNRRRMGLARFEGLTSIEESYLTRFITWQPDVFFEQKYVDNLRARLIRTNLFAGVSIDIIPANNDRVDILINNIEAKHRTIGTSIGYSTAEGVGGEISWEHRNFLHRGNRLKVTARGAEIEQSFASRLELPNFKHLDQTLSFDGAFRRL
jgi:translocation and assembly module TamA